MTDYLVAKIIPDADNKQKVEVVREKHYLRAPLLVKLLQEAVINKPIRNLPDTGLDVQINLDDDLQDLAHFNIAACKDRGACTLFPDPHSYSWPPPTSTYPDIQALIAELYTLGESKPTYNKALWVGSITHQNRREFIGRIASTPELAQFVDAWQINWDDPNKKYVSLQDHSKYKYLIDIEGWGHSGRLKLLLCTRRPVFVLDRPFWDWATYDLQPWVHYIPVARDSSDLLEKIRWAEENPDQAQQIANTASALMMERMSLDNIFQVIHDKLQTLLDSNMYPC